jgi:hypothetical protein
VLILQSCVGLSPKYGESSHSHRERSPHHLGNH